MKITDDSLTDLHVHSSFSYDSDEKTENYLEKAIANGDKRIGFVQHYDYDCFLLGNDTPLCDIDAYAREISMLRDKYGDKIKILFGIEFGYDRRAENRYAELADKYKFDYVINSVHLVGGKDCSLKECWDNRSIQSVYSEYLDRVYESVNAAYPFEIVGHLGYPERYCADKTVKIAYENYSRKIDGILSAIIKRGKVLEINTSTKSSEPIIPHAEVLQKYAEAGGKYVSFGSDAHSVARYKENEPFVRQLTKKLNLIEKI